MVAEIIGTDCLTVSMPVIGLPEYSSKVIPPLKGKTHSYLSIQGANKQPSPFIKVTLSQTN